MGSGVCVCVCVCDKKELLARDNRSAHCHHFRSLQLHSPFYRLCYHWMFVCILRFKISPPLFYGRHTAYRMVDASVVPISHEIAEHQWFNILHTHKLSFISFIDSLLFEPGKETLTAGITKATASGITHTLSDTCWGYEFSEFVTGVLTTSIGVELGIVYIITANSRV